MAQGFRCHQFNTSTAIGQRRDDHLSNQFVRFGTIECFVHIIPGHISGRNDTASQFIFATLDSRPIELRRLHARCGHQWQLDFPARNQCEPVTEQRRSGLPASRTMRSESVPFQWAMHRFVAHIFLCVSSTAFGSHVPV